MPEVRDIKLCSKCKHTKELIEFRHRNDVGRTNELRVWCRSCEREEWKLWYAKNKEERALYKQQEWYKKYNREYAIKYAAEHKKERAFTQRRRVVSKVSNGGHHSINEWEELKKVYEWRCLKCGRQEPFIKLTEDHIVPLKLGGNDNIANIQPLCTSCNSSKKIKVIDYRYGVFL